MNNSKSTRLRKFQTIYKALLRAAAVFLAEFYIMWTLYQFIFEDHDEFRTQKWISVAILTALLVYVSIAAFTDREELSRIRDFLRRQRSPEQILLILLLLWYMVSCAAWSRLDDEPYFAYNDNRLLIVTMSTFLFFPFAELMGKHARRIMEGMLHFTMLIYTPFCAYCICMYYNAAFFFFPSGTRLTRHSADVSMQMGANVNITAAAAVIMFGKERDSQDPLRLCSDSAFCCDDHYRFQNKSFVYTVLLHGHSFSAYEGHSAKQRTKDASGREPGCSSHIGGTGPRGKGCSVQNVRPRLRY